MESLQSGIAGILSKAEGLLGNPVATAVGGAVVGSALTGAVIGGVAAVKKRRRKTAKKKSTKRRKTVKRKTTKRKCSYKYARTAGKGKDRSTRRIRMTKNGQPYVILKSGKARFIKKTSACASRRRKGGRY